MTTYRKQIAREETDSKGGKDGIDSGDETDSTTDPDGGEGDGGKEPEIIVPEPDFEDESPFMDIEPFLML